MQDKYNLLEELKFEIGEISYLKNTKEKILLGTGTLGAKILFVGDDYNLYEGEELKVRPGSSGEFLIKLCDIVGMIPDDYYITTLTKGDTKYRELEDDEKEKLKEFLFMQISLLNPQIIVALGQDAWEVLQGREGRFLEERGKVFQWMGDKKILLTYDTNFAKKSRDDGGKRAQVAKEFWNDLKVVKSI